MLSDAVEWAELVKDPHAREPQRTMRLWSRSMAGYGRSA
uniref:Uncharacterized protein n=1 Tax=Klebsiella pneumoniae TaxID=573 RepID=A0A6G9HRQ2_KLEPN|nr:hypothetical protein [Klebsiella pneumoniae]UFD95719.1 hypothetical protein [Escherichia coli]UQW94361.1 hypothetical protein PCIJMNHK_00130 [Klebsiella variicola]